MQLDSCPCTWLMHGDASPIPSCGGSSSPEPHQPETGRSRAPTRAPTRAAQAGLAAPGGGGRGSLCTSAPRPTAVPRSPGAPWGHTLTQEGVEEEKAPATHPVPVQAQREAGAGPRHVGPEPRAPTHTPPAARPTFPRRTSPRFRTIPAKEGNGLIPEAP